MTAMDYYNVLHAIHRLVKPRTYVEIGVRHGESWQLAGPEVQSIGIDPAPSIQHEPRGDGQLFKGTSDEFFAQYPPSKVFGGRPVDLAFIDGMHLFEFALRDFMNLERYCNQNSTVLVHDCLPIDAPTSARERTTSVWSGDVWKLILCLRQWRPDLQVDVIDTAPTGLAVIRNLDPTNTTLADRYAQLEQHYVPLGFEALGTPEQMRARLNVSSSAPDNLARLCAQRPVAPAPTAARPSAEPSAEAAPPPAGHVATVRRTPLLRAAPKKLGVLLCYNDGDILADVLDHMLINGHDLLVWDHGSTDETPEVLRHYRDAIAGHKHVGREVDFYGLYEAMSHELMDRWVQKYDWISWPDQDEILEGAHRRSSYAEQLHEAFAEGSDWIAFNNVNFWWTDKDVAAITSPVRRVRHYALFSDCAPRIRSWRASKTNVRTFNHNALDGTKHPQNFNLRHYPMRSQAQMRRRVTHDRAGLQRGASNYHYNNMARHLDRLTIDPALLHRDDGLTELNLAPSFKWRTLYGDAHHVSTTTLAGGAASP